MTNELNLRAYVGFYYYDDDNFTNKVDKSLVVMFII